MSKITIDRSVLEQALTYLGDEAPLCSGCAYEWGAAIRVLRAALEQPQGEVVVTTNQQGRCVAVTRQDEEGRILSVVWESKQPQVEQEPVGCITGTYGGYPVVRLINPALVLPFGTALYTHPQPPRQPLTDEEIRAAMTRDKIPYAANIDHYVAFTRAIERAHGVGGEV